MDLLFTRKPIFDTESKVIGYTFLSFENNVVDSIDNMDNCKCTEIVRSNHYYDFTNDTIKDYNLENKKYAESDSEYMKSDNYENNKKLLLFIPVNAICIFDKIFEEIPSDKYVIDLQNPITTQDKYINRIELLKRSGFKICIDENLISREMEDYADFVRINIKNKKTKDILDKIKRMDKKKASLIAVGVDSDKKYEEMKKYGFNFFEGFYFSKPTVNKGGVISINIKTCIDLLNQIDSVNIEKDPDLLTLDLKKIIRIIEKDPVITYKIIKSANEYRNSSSNKISSVETAVTMLGFFEISKELRSIIIREINVKDKEKKDIKAEVVYTALIRTKFFENLFERKAGKRELLGQIILTSMVDLFDIIFEMPIKDVMKDLNLSDDIRKAVIDGEGYLGNLLKLVKNYEIGEWEDVKEISEELDFKFENISDLYTKAIRDSKNDIERLYK